MKKISVQFQTDKMAEVSHLQMAEVDFKGMFHDLRAEFHKLEFTVSMRRDDPFLYEFGTHRSMSYVKSGSKGVWFEGFMNSTEAIITFSVRLIGVDEAAVMCLTRLLYRLRETDLKGILLKCYEQRARSSRSEHVLESAGG